MKKTLLCTAALAAGFIVSLAPVPARCAGQTIEHTIRAGDDLHLIAGYYYGNPRQWRKIWKTNRKNLAGPNRLEPGNILRIEGFLDDGFLGSYEEFLSRVRGK